MTFIRNFHFSVSSLSLAKQYEIVCRDIKEKINTKKKYFIFVIFNDKFR